MLNPFILGGPKKEKSVNQVHGIIPQKQILKMGVRYFLGKNETLIHSNCGGGGG